MAGTRTAPDPSAVAANATNTTLHVIDSSGDQFTDSILTTTVPTTAEMQAWATAYQAATQSSVWKISQDQQWVGDKDPDNAESLFRGSIAEGTNLLWKNPVTLQTQTPRQVAVIAATMQGNQDIPLLTSTEMIALIAAYQAILVGYSLESAQFTGRRERSNNPRIKV